MTDQDDFKLALLQHVPTPAAIDTSISRVQHAAAQASELGANLLLLPEASLTGYNVSSEVAQQVAFERDSAVTEQLAHICQNQAIALAYGYIERDAEQLYNAVNVIDEVGNSIAHYRKTHLWGALDRSLFQPGSHLPAVFELDGWKLGLLICYDIEFPECTRQLALDGAEVILAPTALMTPWTFIADHVTRVRAAENQLFFAYCNYCGAEGDLQYIGRSCLVGPDGEELARAAEEPIMLCETLRRQAIHDIRQALPYHTDRRPELYRSAL